MFFFGFGLRKVTGSATNWPCDPLLRRTFFFHFLCAPDFIFFRRAEMKRDASLPLPFANLCLKGAKFFFADYEVSDLKLYEGIF
jgi:hypothetical protein